MGGRECERPREWTERERERIERERVKGGTLKMFLK